jgi:hypothetical protein
VALVGEPRHVSALGHCSSWQNACDAHSMDFAYLPRLRWFPPQTQPRTKSAAARLWPDLIAIKLREQMTEARAGVITKANALREGFARTMRAQEMGT